MSASSTPLRMLRSTGAATLSQLWRVGVVFLTNLVLRRLVPAEDWGLWYWFEGIFLVLSQLRDLGLPAHFVRLRSRPYRSFVAVELVWGGVLAFLLVVAAPHLAGLNAGDPTAAVALLQAASLYLLLEGLAKVPLTWFEAELAIAEALPAEMTRNAVYMITAIALALAGLGVWSFLLAQLAGVGVYTAMLWWRARPRFDWSVRRPSLPELVRGALPLAGVAILVTAVSKADALLLGPLVSRKESGTYGFAYMVGVVLLANVFVLAVRRALYPALVAFTDDPRSAFRAYHLATLALLSLEVLAAGFLLLNAELVLALLGGRANWDLAEAAGYLRLLVLAPLLQPFARCAEDVLIAQRRDRLLVLLNVVSLCSLSGLGWFLASRHGAIGMAWANLVPLGSLVATWAIWRWSRPGLLAMARDLGRIYAIGLLCFGPALVAVHQLRVGAGGRLALGTAGVAIAAALFLRRFGRDYRAFFGSATSRPPATDQP